MTSTDCRLEPTKSRTLPRKLFSDTKRNLSRPAIAAWLNCQICHFTPVWRLWKQPNTKWLNYELLRFLFFYNRYWPVHKDLLMSALCAKRTNFKRGKFRPVLLWKKAAEHFKGNKLCDISWTWFLWLIGPSGLRGAYERETQERICQLMILSFSNYV